MGLTPVTFQKFDGGIVDLYIGTDINKAERLNNFLIDETAKPYVRDGTSIYSTRLPFSANSTRPSGIYLGPQPFSHPVVITGASAYTANETSGWTEITGVNTSFLPTKTDATNESVLLWRRQLIACAPVASVPPSTIYCTNYVQPASADNAAAYTALTLGLPALATSPTIGYTSTDAYVAAYAFYYKYTFIDYTGTLFAFFGNPNKPGLVNGSVNNAGGPSVSSIAITDIPVLANTAYTNYDTTASVTTNTTFTAGSLTATVVSGTGIVKGQQIIATPGYVTQGTVVTAISGTTITLSQPALTTGLVASVVYSQLTVQIYRTINGGSVFFYTAMVANGTTTYTDAIADATIQLQQPIYTSGGALGYDQPPTNAVAVTQTNDFFWYATSNTLYQSIQGAPGACPSSMSDQIDQKIIGLSDVSSFPVLYCDKTVYRVENTFDSFGNNGFSLREIHKTAGAISNASIVKTPVGLIWFGNGGIFHTDGYTVRKISKHLNISYQVWASSKVVGEYDPSRNMVYWTITSLNPAVSCDAILVLHLAYGITEESVFSTLSAANNLYPSALRFSQSQDISASDPLETTTATWTSGSPTMTVVSATGIRAGQTITAAGIPYGTTVSSISGTTVTMSANANASSFGASQAVTFSQKIYSPFYGNMLFTDRLGYLLYFNPNSLTDVRIDTTLYPTAMVKNTIIYDWATAGFDQGTAGFRKYTPDVILEVDAETPVAIQIRHRRDDGGGGWSGEGGTPPSGKGIAGSPGGGATGNPGVPEIRQDGAITWNVTDCLWGNDPIEHMWNDFATVSGKRSVPLGQLRSNRRQLKFTNSYTVISNSDTLGTATIAARSGTTPPTLTLDTVGQLWITDPEGYWITLAVDSYVQTYQILSRYSDTVLYLADPYSTLTVGSTKWEIKGFRKFERPRIVSFTLNAEVEGPTFGQATAQVGANA